jgi:hypothetical protein
MKTLQGHFEICRKDTLILPVPLKTKIITPSYCTVTSHNVQIHASGNKSQNPDSMSADILGRF